MAPLSAPEITLLRQAAHPARTDAGLAAVSAALAAPLDWTFLVQTAMDHGVAGLLSQMLLDAATPLPEDLTSALATYVAHCHECDRAAVAQLLALLDALAQAGVTALPFKGPALARSAYATPKLRPCRDLDILIREADIAATFATLASLGLVSQYPDLRPTLRQAYHRYNGQDILGAPDGLPVEPHWTFAPRTLAAPLDTAALFARAQPIMLRGRAATTLSPEDALVVAGLHGSKEQWARLVWVADVAGLLHNHPNLDAAAVLARATAAGLRRMLLIGVALAVDLLDAPCPRALATALRADPTSQRLADVAAARLWDQAPTPSVFAWSSFRWRMRERLADRLHYAAGTLLTARVPHYRTVDLPDALHFLYPLVRIGRDFVALPLRRLYRTRLNR